MGKKFDFYYETEFLKDLMDSFDELYRDLSLDDRFDKLRDYMKLLMRQSQLVVDSKEGIINMINQNRENQQWIRLYKKVVDGNISLSEVALEYIDFDEVNPTAVFFLSNSDLSQQLQDDYGMMFISSDNKYQMAHFVFGRKEIGITKSGKYMNYDFISEHNFKHPCNALVLNDRYFLIEDKERIRENLSSLLKNILPEKLNKKIFQLLIHSGDGRKYIHAQSRYNIVREVVNEMNLSYVIDIKLTTKLAAHNRKIITNYLSISAGHKFALFNGSKATENEQMGFSFIAGNEDIKSTIRNISKEYLRIEKDTLNIGTVTVVMPPELSGQVSNRLLKN